jgi:hypothetical protein
MNILQVLTHRIGSLIGVAGLFVIKKNNYEVWQLTLLIIFMQWRVLTTVLSFTLMLFNMKCIQWPEFFPGNKLGQVLL